jgi:hypothetical protein
MAVKTLAVLCNCGASANEETRQLLKDTITNLRIYIRAQRPRVLTDLVELDLNAVHTVLIEDCLSKGTGEQSRLVQQEKSVALAMERVARLRQLVDELLWSATDTLLPIDLDYMVNTLVEVLSEVPTKFDTNREYVHGLGSDEYKEFISKAKCGILDLLRCLMQNYRFSLYSHMCQILRVFRGMYISSENM